MKDRLENLLKKIGSDPLKSELVFPDFVKQSKKTKEVLEELDVTLKKIQKIAK